MRDGECVDAITRKLSACSLLLANTTRANIIIRLLVVVQYVIDRLGSYTEDKQVSHDVHNVCTNILID